MVKKARTVPATPKIIARVLLRESMFLVTEQTITHAGYLCPTKEIIECIVIQDLHNGRKMTNDSYAVFIAGEL